jgi:hypothetical protein
MTNSLLMDIDYADLAWAGDGSREQLRMLWDRLAECGFAGAIQDCFFNGQALYQSSRFSWFSNPQRGPYPLLVRRLREFDPLAESIRLAQERGLECYPYVRLVDEAFSSPCHADELFVRNPRLWYQTRCGGYSLTGVPCFAYPEVRNLFLRRCEDLAELGAKGFFFGASRSHSGLFTPYIGHEGWDIWGFNPPITDEYQNRYGVDLRRVESVRRGTSDEPRLRGYRLLEYEGTQPVDESRFRAILGEGVDLFLRCIRARFPDFRILIELTTTAISPGSNFPHNLFTLDLKQLVRDGIIDEWYVPGNWKSPQEQRLEDLRLLHPFLHESTARLGAWINDIFILDGGVGSHASVEDVEAYLRRLAECPLDRAIVHEALFLLNHPQSATIWSMFKRFVPNPKDTIHARA